MKKKTLSIKKQQFINLYVKNLGNITQTCKEVNINRKTYYEWLKNDPAFENGLKEINQYRDDLVFEALLKRIAEGSDVLIKWYLDKNGERMGLWETNKQDTPTIINIEIVGG